jgi:hypothetical protein
MTELGKSLILLGALIALAGIVLVSGFGRDWLGRLPGDLRFTRGPVKVYFPLVTCLLLSLLLSLLAWLFRTRR